MNRPRRWLGPLVTLLVGGLLGAWVATHGIPLRRLGNLWPAPSDAAPARGEDPSRGELFLADFETPDEVGKRWKPHGVVATRTDEHATHGRYAVQLTFGKKGSPAFIMEDYLSNDTSRSDWRPFAALSFDLYNAQEAPARLILQVKDRQGHRFKKPFQMNGKTSKQVTVPISELQGTLNVAHVVQFNLFQWKPAASSTLYLDAVRLHSGADAAETAAGPTGPIPQPEVTVASGAVTPNRLGGLLFSREIARWQGRDPATRQPVVRVPVALVGPERPLSVGFSISGGIPLAMGQLRPEAAVQLRDARGGVWPAQTRPLARWEDGSVKWLLVTTQVPPTASGRRLVLEYGAPVKPDPVLGPRVQVEETPELVTVTTGPMRFAVSTRRFALFEAASVDADRNGVFEDAERLAGSGDLVVTHRHTEFRSSLDTQSYTLTVEEAGPLRATLKASGWFRDRSGKGFGQFVVRIQAFAGLPHVRVSHTFIYTGYPANRHHHEYEGIKLPDNETIQELRVELPATILAGAQVVTADEEGVFTTPLSASTSIQQNAHDAYQLFVGNTVQRRGVHNDGWLLAQNAAVGVLVGVRDAWQQFPKELAADPGTGRLIMKLWPESAGELNLETGPESRGPGDVARGSAFGLGKTHELFVSFLGRPIAPDTAQGLAGLLGEPWLLAAQPEWLAATDALGTLGPAQPGQHPQAEAMLDGVFGWAERQPRDFAWYGMLDYGDTRLWYRKEAYDKSYDAWGWHPEGRWGWHNCEGVGSHSGAWVSFLRTLDLAFLRFAEAKTRHVMDVDTVHYNTVAHDPRLSKKIPETFSQVGSMHRHSAYHWGGRNDEADHTNVTGILLYYYLTGSERAWEVAQEAGEFFLQNRITYTKHPDIAPSRAIGNILWGDVLLYEATQDERYRQGAERWVKVLLEGQQPGGAWLENYDPLTGNWKGDFKPGYLAFHILPGLMAYHRLTGDPAVARAIVQGTDALINGEKYLQFFDALAYSYLLTGQRRYLDEGLRRVHELVKAQRHTEDPTMDGMVFQKAIYDRVGPVLYSVPFLLGALEMPDFLTLQKTMSTEGQGAGDVGRGMVTEPAPLAPRPSPPAYEVLIMPSTEKVLPEVGTLKGAHKNPAVVSLARNEYESVQLVLRSSATTLEHVTMEAGELRQMNGDGVIPQQAITWSPVGFVKTRKPSYDVEHIGWWPDSLPGPAPFEVPAGWPQPIWLTIYAAPGTPAGEYTGTVTIRPANAPAQPVQLNVTVWDFDLPTTPSLKTAFDLYTNRIESGYKQFFPQWWGRWASRPGELAQRFYDDLMHHRLAPIFNADVSDDRALESLRQFEARGLSAFAIGRYSGSFGNNWPKDPQELERLQPVYRSYAARLREAALFDRHYIYTFDEPTPGSPRVAEVARMIHAADPALRNLVVLGDAPDAEQQRDWLKDMDVICLRNVTFDAEQAQRLQHMGKEMWLYVSGPRPPYPTLVIDYPAMAYRILPWMCWKYGVKGLLYWSVNYWTTNPYDNPMNTKWEQNGNGSLYYPGPDGPVPSIRLEVLRDGMEDYEYLARLRQLVTQVTADGTLMADEATRALIAQAEPLLVVDPQLVESMRTYSRDPKVLEQNRAAVADLIEQFQRMSVLR